MINSSISTSNADEMFTQKQSQRPAGATSPACGGDDGTAYVGAEPPLTNRGVFNTEPDINISIHWLEITFFSSPKNPMTEFMSVILPWHLDSDYEWENDFQLRGTSGRFYNATYDGPDGVVLYAYPKLGTYCSLQISGLAIEKIGQDTIFRLLELCQSNYPRKKKLGEYKDQWQCTRIDIAFDGVPFSPTDCLDAWLSGNVRTRSSPDSYGWRSNSEGDTFYAGKRISGRYLRVYNRRGPVRLEIELKKRYARPFVKSLMANGFHTLRYSGIGLLRDMLDFIDKDSDTNKSRAALLPWWKQLVGDTAKIRYSKETIVTTATAEEQKLASYFERMKPTLFLFSKVLGHDLNEVASQAEFDLKPHHRSKVLRLRPKFKFSD